ncbi:hypothetical protein [Leptolyngbya sp. FACHB-16]|uniref:hypothetical protein n=1 Tax=unclassified Leptolyngbya TaxID=2650499 RepID=UPI001688A302|nr:hypothetical protein [Leptolyngbya sp. FACHB-16]MBD2157315.1 hypothetical protein [Leptolyngbya sp. FACHB-16]
MPRPPIIQANQSYLFTDYFRLSFAPSDILACFDITHHKAFLTLPQVTGPLDRLENLVDRIEKSLPRLSLTKDYLLAYPFRERSRPNQSSRVWFASINCGNS